MSRIVSITAIGLLLAVALDFEAGERNVERGWIVHLQLRLAVDLADRPLQLLQA